MTKTSRRRAARAARQAATSTTQIKISSNQPPSLSDQDWDQLLSSLEGLLVIETETPFKNLELLTPTEIWLVLDLGFVRVKANTTASLRLAFTRVLDAFGCLCVHAELLRPWKNLYSEFWKRVVTSDIYQRHFQGNGPWISEFIRFSETQGMHVALRWHGRRLQCAQVMDPLRRFLETTVEVYHLPIQLGLRFEECQLTTADVKSMHTVLKVSIPEAGTSLCQQTTLHHLSLRDNLLLPPQLQALTTILDDPDTRRIDSLVMDNTTPDDMEQAETYSASFQRTVTAALRTKSIPVLDVGFSLSLNDCKVSDSHLVEAIEHAFTQANRPIRRLSLAHWTLPRDNTPLRFTRLILTPFPTATKDFELELSDVRGWRGQDEIKRALFISLAELATEAIPRVHAATTVNGERVTCRLLYPEIFQDQLLTVRVDTQVSTTQFYDVTYVTQQGFFHLMLPDLDAQGHRITGWVNTTSIANLCIGDSMLVGSNCTRLILDGSAEYYSSDRFLTGMITAMGSKLSCLALRNHPRSFNELPKWLAQCPQLLQLNAANGKPQRNDPIYRPSWEDKATEDTGATLQFLNLVNCGLDASSLSSLPKATVP